VRLRVVTIGLALLVVGCGGGHEKLPPACSEGPESIVKALDKAPGPVTMQGTRISDCFNRSANGDDIQIVGTFLLAAAQQLGDRARNGNQEAAVRLGYLIGAARRGAARNNGLGSEIVRRLEAETTVGAARRAAFNRGLRAGAASG
jgi:hypothetical protein